MTETKARDLFPGAVEMMVLRLLKQQPMHGYALVQRIQQASNDLLQVEEGSLYPALYRMTRRGWIKGVWGVSENNRRAKYYHLTAEGKRQFQEQTSGWQRFAAAVTQAVGTVTAPNWAS